jgi:hypothetical protein
MMLKCPASTFCTFPICMAVAPLLIEVKVKVKVRVQTFSHSQHCTYGVFCLSVVRQPMLLTTDVPGRTRGC